MPLEYAATHDWPYHVSCGAVIYRKEGTENLIALLYRGPSFADPESWHLPAGTLHYDETLQEGAMREVAEESGLEVKLGRYLGALHRSFVDAPSGRHMDKTTHYFLATVQDEVGKAGQDGEHDEVQWVPFQIAKEKLAAGFKREDEVVERASSLLI